MTAQIHEKLILDGEETSMAFCPPLPKKHPRIYEPKAGEIAPEEGDYIFQSTGCWRRYQGTWEIREGRFYLVNLHGGLRMYNGEPRFADWFSGELRVPRGEMLHYVHMGFGSVYEEEVHIKIENGVVVGTQVIDNRGKGFRSKLDLPPPFTKPITPPDSPP